MKTTPQSSSYARRTVVVSLALILLMFLTFSTGVKSLHQESKSRLLLEAKMKRQQLVAVRSRTTDRLRRSWNTNYMQISGGGSNSVVKTPPVACFQLQRIRHYCPPFSALAPPTPPSSSDYEIDPRYGVEKRLVPSGPNPLHN